MKGVHGRFLKDSEIYRAVSTRALIETEEVCMQMDKDAQKDFTFRMTKEEYFRC